MVIMIVRVFLRDGIGCNYYMITATIGRVARIKIVISKKIFKVNYHKNIYLINKYTTDLADILRALYQLAAMMNVKRASCRVSLHDKIIVYIGLSQSMGVCLLLFHTPLRCDNCILNIPSIAHISCM